MIISLVRKFRSTREWLAAFQVSNFQVSNLFCGLAGMMALLIALPSWAQEQAAAPKPSAIEMFAPIIFIFVVFYFLLIRPQAKKQKEHKKFLEELRRGDEVVTNSGILGKIEAITDSIITLQISDGVNVRVLRSQVAGSMKAMASAEGKA